VNFSSGTGTDQNALQSFTGSTNLINTTATLTATWQRFTYTVPVGATATELAFNPYYTPTGTTTTNDYFEITGIQLEIGSVATNFARNGATIQGELAACQRYYQRFTGTSNAGSTMGLQGFAGSTTLAVFSIVFPVQMRIAPTSFESSNLAFYNYRTGVNSTGGSFIQWQGFPTNSELRYTHGSAIYTINDFVSMTSNLSASTFIGFSAEL